MAILFFQGRPGHEVREGAVSAKKSVITLQVNRAAELFEQAAASIAGDMKGIPAPPVFSYWCKYYGENPDESAGSVKLIERSIYNTLESKSALNKLVKVHRVAELFPATYTRVSEALAHTGKVGVWFVKPAHLSGGRGIQVVAAENLSGFDLPRHHIIQEGIENIALIQGKKFTCRIYVFIWNKGLYHFDEGFALIHAPAFRSGSTDYAVQVDHRGFQEDREGGVRMVPLSALDIGPRILDRSARAVLKLRPVFDQALAASSALEYIILGIDLLLLNNGEIRFIEINAIPNFIHSPQVNEQVNVPLFAHVMRMVYGLGSDRFFHLAS